MTIDPQDPRFTKSPGEPNSDTEPGLSEEKPQAVKKSPVSSGEPGDYVSEIRQTLVSEESTKVKRRTDSLLQRITRTLRRVTGTLREPDQPRSEEAFISESQQPRLAENVPTGRLVWDEDSDISDELLTGRLSKVSPSTPSEIHTGRLDSTALPEIMPDELLTGRLGSLSEQDTQDQLLTGRLGSAPEAESDSLLTGRLGKGQEEEIPDNLLTGRLGLAPDAEAPDNLLTGRLGPVPEDEIPDNLLTGRLGQAPDTEIPDSLLTGRLSAEPKNEPPSDMLTGRLGQAPETEVPENLLTGRLDSEARLEQPGDMVTRRLDDVETEDEVADSIRTGRLGQEPESELPDSLLTGRLGKPEDEEPSGDLLTGPLGQGLRPEIPGGLVTRPLDDEPEPPADLISSQSGGESAEQTGTATRPEAPRDLDTRPLDEADLDDAFFAGRLGSTQRPAFPDNLVTRRLDAEEETDMPGKPLAGAQSGEPKPQYSRDLVTRRLDEEPEAEISDQVLTGRLGWEADAETGKEPTAGWLGAAPDLEIGESPSSGKSGSAPIEEPLPTAPAEAWSELPESDGEAAQLLESEENAQSSAELEPEAALRDTDPITLLESGAIAALGVAEEEAALRDQDWMEEIREESVHDDTAPDTSTDAINPDGMEAQTWAEQTPVEPYTPRWVTQPLRDFFTGIFKKPGERGKRADDSEISDALVTGRLERSLGVETGGTFPDQASEEDLLGLPGVRAEEETTDESALEERLSASYQKPPEAADGHITDAQTAQEQEDFLHGLEVKFSKAAEMGGDISGYELYPEDEALLWGAASEDTGEPFSQDLPISPEDIWGRGADTDSTGLGADLRQEIWGDGSEEKALPSNEDQYAATFLTGEDFLPAMLDQPKGETDQEELLGTILSQKPGSENDTSVQDMRAIALEDYEEGDMDYSAYAYRIDWGNEEADIEEEWAGPRAKQAEQFEQLADYETSKIPAKDFKSWFANRKTSQKVLLIEAAIVVLALIAAIPYFITMILRGQEAPPVEAQPIASNLPHPTGLTLPGGWYFPLERSTIVNGEWQPITNEWLEGSEVRRVVAIPWSPQTEAVVKTFQVGDEVALHISNGDTQTFRVFSIDQVAVSNTQVYSDTNASLAIILYKGKDTTRWVIICKP